MRYLTTRGLWRFGSDVALKCALNQRSLVQIQPLI
jgi:hypothetical protein